MERYKKNWDSYFTEETQKELLTKTFAVLGCGGQGGYIALFLAHLGVKKIILFDGDKYEISNLNRQPGCFESTIGKYKVDVVGKMCKDINSNVQIETYTKFFITPEDAEHLLECDFIFDEMDYLNDYAEQTRTSLKSLLIKNIPIINGSNAFMGSDLVFYGNKSIDLYDEITYAILNFPYNPSKSGGQPAYLCAITAGLVVLEMINYFNGCSRILNESINYDYFRHKIKEHDTYPN